MLAASRTGLGQATRFLSAARALSTTQVAQKFIPLQEESADYTYIPERRTKEAMDVLETFLRPESPNKDSSKQTIVQTKRSFADANSTSRRFLSANARDSRRFLSWRAGAHSEGNPTVLDSDCLNFKTIKKMVDEPAGVTRQRVARGGELQMSVHDIDAKAPWAGASWSFSVFEFECLDFETIKKMVANEKVEVKRRVKRGDEVQTSVHYITSYGHGMNTSLGF